MVAPHSFKKVLWLCLIAGMLNACATGPTRIDVDQDLQNQLRQVENWHAEGKLGVRVEGDAHSANFDWHNDKDNFSLRLSGPFGQGTTWLKRQGRRVTLVRPNEPLQQARTAEQLMEEQLGWQVPVSNLRYWIKGIAAPEGRPAQVWHNDDGTVSELRQQGWHITYSRYVSHNGWALPGKLVAKRDDIQLTMIIKNWQLPVPEALSPAQ